MDIDRWNNLLIDQWQGCDLPHLIESIEQGEFDIMAEQWTLQDIEESLQARIDYLSKSDLGDVPYSDYTDCYMALAQVKQAQALERIAKLLDGFRVTGFPVERVN